METPIRDRWFAELTDERTVVRVAEPLHSRLPMDGACYQIAMFLEYHLTTHYRIKGEAVVGFVNDGTDNDYGYHSWFEFAGKMTDIALCRPQFASLQKCGPVLIHGRRVTPGWDYHKQRPAVVEARLDDMLKHPYIAELEEIQRRMTTIAGNPPLIREYLDGHPEGLNYLRIAEIVERI